LKDPLGIGDFSILVTLVTVGFLAVLGFSQSFTETNMASVQAVAVGIYWDTNCTQEVNSIDWGTLIPGSSKTVEVYARNERDPIRLSLTATDWQPSEATEIAGLRYALKLGDGLVTSVIGTSSAEEAVDASARLGNFKALGIYWNFFWNGSYLKYANSSDAFSWTENDISTISDSRGVSVWFDEDHNLVHFALANQSEANGSKYRSAQVFPNGSLVWSTNDWQPIASGLHYFPSIITDSSGYPVVAFVNKTGSGYDCVVYKSSANDGTWNTSSDFPQVIARNCGFYTSPLLVPLSNGRWSVLVARAYGYVSGRLWNGTDLGFSHNATYPPAYATSFSALGIGDTAHALYIRLAAGVYEVRYASFTSSGWGSEVELHSDTRRPAVALSRSGDTLYALYGGTSNSKVLCRTSTGGGDWRPAIELASGQDLRNMCASYDSYSGLIGVQWTNRSASPYQVCYASISPANQVPTTINRDDLVQIALTLVVQKDAKGITAFNFDIVISAEDMSPPPLPPRDATPPKVSITSPGASAVVNGSSLLVRWVGRDSGSGIDYYSVYLNDGSEIKTEDTSYRFLGLDEGLNSIRVVARDMAGNVGTDDVEVIVDNTAPRVLISCLEGDELRGTATLKFSASDENLATILLQIDDEVFDVTDMESYEWNTSGFSDGIHVVKITAIDEAANANSTSTSILVDNTEPKLALFNPPDGAVVGGFLDVQFTVLDLTPVGVIYILDDDVAIDVTGKSGFSVNTADLEDGPHLISFVLTDALGNSVENSTRIIVDNTLPSLDLGAPLNGSYLRDVADVNLTGEDSTFERMELFLAGELATTWQSSGFKEYDWNTENCKDGTKAIEAVVYDRAGNFVKKSLIVTVDNTAPNVSIISSPEKSGVTGNFDVRFSASDANLAKIFLYIDDDVSDVTGADFYRWNTFGVDDGEHTITLRALDRAGNAGQAQISITTINQYMIVQYLTDSAFIALILLLYRLVARKPKKHTRLKIAAIAAMLILIIPCHSGASSLIETYTVSCYGFIGHLPPLHTEGRYIKDLDGNIVILRGGWRCSPGFEDSTVGMFPFEGEQRGWGSAVVPYTYRQAAVGEMLDAALEWGFNSIAELINCDWWIYNSRTILGFPRDQILTDTTYREAITDFLDIAYQKGLYVQVRVYTVDAQEGKVPWPFPVGIGYEHDGSIFPGWYDGNHPDVYDGPPLMGMESFGQFCYDFAYDLFSAKPHHYPNVLLSFFDDVDPRGYDPDNDPWGYNATGPDDLWFKTFDLAATRIREAEQAVGSDPHILVNHYMYCEDLQWVAHYINGSYRTDNVIFSSHIYRHHKTFDLFGPTPNASVATEYIRSYIGDGDKLAYKYIMDTYNVPVLATAIGCFRGYRTDAEGEAEYQTFVKSLQALNEFKIGYWAYCWPQCSSNEFVMSNNTYSRSPNYADRVGQALIYAISDGT